MQNFHPPIPPPQDRRRQLIAITAVALSFTLLAVAFLTGGKKEKHAKPEPQSPDTSLGVVDGAASYQPGNDTPDDWLLATGGGTPQDSPSADTTTGKPPSSLVTGDDPIAAEVALTAAKENPVGDSTAAPLLAANRVAGDASPMAPLTASANQPTTQPISGPTDNGAHVTASSQHDPRTAGMKSDASAPVSSKGSGDGDRPSVTSQNSVAASTKSSPSNLPTSVSSTPPAQTSPTNSSITVPPPNVRGSDRPTVAINSVRQDAQPSPSSAKSSQPAIASAPSALIARTPSFVSPKMQQRGVLAQTPSLITEEEFRPSPRSESAPAQSAPISSATPKAPAKVSHSAARAFARQTTDEFRRTGALSQSQAVRLPKRAETKNTKIWRDDDTPDRADERRPFGLIVVEEKAAFTPEGIPLRTDIAPGTSPLEKTGPDKPLWKRPE